MVSVRTIFLFIRGVDQTGRAFTAVDKRIAELIKKQKKLKKGLSATDMATLKFLKTMRALDRATYRLLFAGAAFVAFAGLMAMGMANIIEQSSLGALYMEDWNRVMEQFSMGLSEALIGGPLGQFLSWLMQVIVNLSKDPSSMGLIAGAGTIGLAFFGIGGAIMFTVGFIGKFVTTMYQVYDFIKTSLIPFLAKLVLKVKALGISWNAVLVPLMAVVAGFLAGYEIGQWLAKTLGGLNTVIIGLAVALAPLIASIWMLATGVSISTAGLAALAGTAALGAGIALAGYMQQRADEAARQAEAMSKGRQLGTVRVPRSGLAFLHEGEMIFNPQLPISPPPQMRGVGGGMVEINVTQYIDNIGVEADEDRLAQKTAEYIADELDRRLG